MEDLYRKQSNLTQVLMDLVKAINKQARYIADKVTSAQPITSDDKELYETHKLQYKSVRKDYEAIEELINLEIKKRN